MEWSGGWTGWLACPGHLVALGEFKINLALSIKVHQGMYHQLLFIDITYTTYMWGWLARDHENKTSFYHCLQCK